MKYNGLNVFDIILDELDIGIKATSLVTLPAIESNFLHFGEDKPQFLFSNEEKRELIGAIMIPDKLIYRKVGDHAFYVNFTKDVIKELTSKMIKTGTAGVFTVQHKYDLENEEVDVQEIWVKESENDKSVDFGIDEVIGTAFMKVKVNSETLWNQIKENGLNGFSIELDASIVEKNELIFKQEEPEEMKITDLFPNSIEANGVKMYFNSDLGKNAYLVIENGEGKPAPYTGEFNHENVIYKVEKGVVFEAEDVQLSTNEAIENLITQFGTVKESVESLLDSKKEIEDKEAELEQLKSQFELEKEEFTKLKQKGINPISVNLSKGIADSSTASNEWMKKFK